MKQIGSMRTLKALVSGKADLLKIISNEAHFVGDEERTAGFGRTDAEGGDKLSFGKPR